MFPYIKNMETDLLLLRELDMDGSPESPDNAGLISNYDKNIQLYSLLRDIHSEKIISDLPDSFEIITLTHDTKDRDNEPVINYISENLKPNIENYFNSGMRYVLILLNITYINIDYLTDLIYKAKLDKYYNISDIDTYLRSDNMYNKKLFLENKELIGLDNLNMNYKIIDYLIDLTKVTNKRKFIQSGHSNALLIDLVDRTAERFEPNGCYTTNNDLDGKLSVFFKSIGIKKYISPIDFNVYEGPQILHGKFIKEMNPNIEYDKLTAKAGYCLSWSFLYLDNRLLNENYTQIDFLNQFVSISKTMPEFAHRYIKKYRYMLYSLQKLREKYDMNESLERMKGLFNEFDKITSI
jgi:hypothetical protein